MGLQMGRVYYFELAPHEKNYQILKQTSKCTSNTMNSITAESNSGTAK